MNSCKKHLKNEFQKAHAGTGLGWYLSNKIIHHFHITLQPYISIYSPNKSKTQRRYSFVGLLCGSGINESVLFVFYNYLELQSSKILTKEEQDKLVCIMLCDNNYISIFIYYYRMMICIGQWRINMYLKVKYC